MTQSAPHDPPVPQDPAASGSRDPAPHARGGRAPRRPGGLGRALLLWTLALALTLGSAVWQRLSGPTYPLRVRGEVSGAGAGIEAGGSLPRSGTTGQPLEIELRAGPGVTGVIEWRRFPTSDPWQRLPLQRRDGSLAAQLPAQPPAGKVEYRARLHANGAERTADSAELVLPRERAAVARFKGAVSAAALIPHIILMFLGMLWSARAGLEAADGGERLLRHSLLAFGLLLLGGLVFGPLVQKQAFGAAWTGWPFGRDLTDNKTLVAVLAWLVALLRAWAGARAGRAGAGRAAAIAAALITLAIFAVPHSTLGSELDYTSGEQISA